MHESCYKGLYWHVNLEHFIISRLNQLQTLKLLSSRKTSYIQGTTLGMFSFIIHHRFSMMVLICEVGTDRMQLLQGERREK